MQTLDRELDVQPRPWRPQLIVLAVFVLMMPVVVGIGWIWSLQGVQRRLTEQEQQLRYAQEELQRARDQVGELSRTRESDRRAFWQTAFDGADLSGATIILPGNAFQRASFQDGNLENTTLQAGRSAFQFARFDRANLRNATLTGEDASFQEATFAGADLTGSQLNGGTSSFQRASFENADLSGARLAGNFQFANLSGARLEGADLSLLDGSSLGSCYFDQPPTYNDETRFPTGFDPEVSLWKRTGE